MSDVQKKCIKYSLIGSVVFVALSFQLEEILIRFLLVGELPGKISLLSPDVMLTVTSLCILLVVGLLVRGIILTSQKSTKSPQLPSRRYQSIQ